MTEWKRTVRGPWTISLHLLKGTCRGAAGEQGGALSWEPGDLGPRHCFVAGDL